MMADIGQPVEDVAPRARILAVVRWLSALFLIAVAALSPLRAAPALSQAEIRTAANQLLATVTRSYSQNTYFPEFATEKLQWLQTRASKGAVSVLLLQDLAKFHLSGTDLMASGTVDGRELIVIGQPMFLHWLGDGGRTSSPFTEQQRNDFMLALVHEVVHLQNPRGAPARNHHEPVHEESRTWREVDLNVVRQLRRGNHRMHSKFLQADDALLACADQLPCLDLVTVIAPR